MSDYTNVMRRCKTCRFSCGQDCPMLYPAGALPMCPYEQLADSVYDSAADSGLLEIIGDMKYWLDDLINLSVAFVQARPQFVGLSTLERLVVMGVLEIHHEAQMNGYISRKGIGKATVYSGRYGNGFRYHFPDRCSTRFHRIRYYVFTARGTKFMRELSRYVSWRTQLAETWPGLYMYWEFMI